MNNRQHIEGEDLDFVIDQMEHVRNLVSYGSREDIEHSLWHLPEIPDDDKLFNWEYLADYQRQEIRLFGEFKGKTLEFFGLFDEAFEYYKTNFTIFRSKGTTDGNIIKQEIDMYNFVSNSKARMLLHANKIEEALNYLILQLMRTSQWARE